MRPFDLFLPTTLDGALALAAQHGDEARWIGGGAMLMVLLKERLVQPSAVISLTDIAELRGLNVGNDGLRAGAATTLRTLERSSEVQQRYPVLVEALRVVGNVRVRNVATIGGHLAQADPHMDLPPVLAALGATAVARSVRGERRLALHELLVDYYETCLEADELIVSIEIPPLPARTQGAYLKFCALSPNDWPTVGVAAFLEADDGRVGEARIVAGCVADRPLRVSDAEALIRGERLTAASIAEVARRYAQAAEPLDDFRGSAEYKRTVTEVYVRRAIEAAAGRAALAIGA